MFQDDMHYIQKEILTSLAARSPQRFSQLQPPRIPNNTFSYHSKKLVTSGYIVMADGGYVATRKALKTLQYESNHSKRTGSPALITVLYVTNDKQQTLLLRRSNRPFVDWYGLPSGLMHKNENLEYSAKRELFEKTTINASNLHFAGVLDFKYLEKESEDLFDHAVAFIYTYHIEGDGDELDGQETRYGVLHWSDLSDEKILPEVHGIAKMVKSEALFVESVDFEEPIATA